MKVFIQSIVAQILLNPYIFWRGYQAIPPKKSWRIPYILFFILELSIFFFGFTFRNVLPDSVMIAMTKKNRTSFVCFQWLVIQPGNQWKKRLLSRSTSRPNRDSVI